MRELAGVVLPGVLASDGEAISLQGGVESIEPVDEHRFDPVAVLRVTFSQVDRQKRDNTRGLVCLVFIVSPGFETTVCASRCKFATVGSDAVGPRSIIALGATIKPGTVGVPLGEL
jgi:hypothetical protein